MDETLHEHAMNVFDKLMEQSTDKAQRVLEDWDRK
jgi:hypothetical protein